MNSFIDDIAQLEENMKKHEQKLKEFKLFMNSFYSENQYDYSGVIENDKI